MEESHAQERGDQVDMGTILNNIADDDAHQRRFWHSSDDEMSDNDGLSMPEAASAEGSSAAPFDESSFHKMGKRPAHQVAAGAPDRHVGEADWVAQGTVDSGLGDEYENVQLVQQMLSTCDVQAIHDHVATQLFVSGGLLPPSTLPDEQSASPQRTAPAPRAKPQQQHFSPRWKGHALDRVLQRVPSGFISRLELSGVARRRRQALHGVAPSFGSGASTTPKLDFGAWCACHSHPV